MVFFHKVRYSVRNCCLGPSFVTNCSLKRILAQNRLEGTLPPEWGSLANMESLWVNHSNLVSLDIVYASYYPVLWLRTHSMELYLHSGLKWLNSAFCKFSLFLRMFVTCLHRTFEDLLKLMHSVALYLQSIPQQVWNPCKFFYLIESMTRFW